MKTYRDVPYVQHESVRAPAFFWHLTYGEALAALFVHMAQKKQKISARLLELAQTLPAATQLPHGIPFISEHDLKLITPADECALLRKIEWFQQRIQEKSLPGFEEAAILIKSWAYRHTREPEQKRQLVVGVITIAIPGITMGRLRRKEPMSIIMEQNIQQHRLVEYIKKIPQAVARVLEHAFIMADKKTERLEPEISDWLFGEKTLSFYTAPEKIISQAHKDVLRLGIVHSTTWEQGKPVLLAISPALNSDSMENRWNLEQMEV